MASLEPPTVRVHASFLEAMAEFRDERRGGPADHTLLGLEINEFGTSWESPDGFRRYVRHLHDVALEDAPRPPGWVPWTTLWWLDGSQYLGRLAIRHRLTPALRLIGRVERQVRVARHGRGH